MYGCVRWPLVCSLALNGLGLGVVTEFFVEEDCCIGWLTAYYSIFELQGYTHVLYDVLACSLALDWLGLGLGLGLGWLL